MKPTITYSTTFGIRQPNLTFVKWLLFFFFFFGMYNTFAQKTWDGGGDGTTWGSANNWNPNGVPTSAQTVTIASGQTVTINAAAVALDLTNSGTLNINANLTISNGGDVTNNSGGSLVFNSTGVINGGGGGANGVLVTINSGSNISTANAGGVDASFAQSTGNRGQSFNSNVIYTFKGSVNQTANFINTTISNLIISNTGGSVTLNAATTITGGVLINNGGGSLTGGALTHNLAGNWINNGTYVPGTSTINLNGTTQSIGGGSITAFNNLSLTNGTKTFGVQTTINGKLTISSTAVADFGSINTHIAGTMTLGTLGTNTGKFGSTSTSATAPVFKNDTYFTAGTTGYITVSTSTCTAPTITLSSIPNICPGALSYAIPYTAVTGGANLYSISGTGITSVTNGALNAPSSSITVGLSSGAVAGATISPSAFTVSSSVTGCVSANLSGSVTVNQNVGVPSFTVGATTVCQDAANTTYTATATNSTGITYSVSPVGAGTIGSTTGIMDWNAAFNGTATITASAAGCNGPQTANRIVTVTPTVGTPSTPSPAASTICQASSPTAYTTSATNATSYIWTVTGTGNTISGTGTTGTVTWASGFTGSATVSVRANGCNGPSALASTTVTVTPTVGTPSFSAGATTVCQDAANTTYTATATNSTGITYTVSPSGAGSIDFLSGEMDWDAAFSGTATITASAAGCNGPKTANRVVTVTPTVGTPSTPSPAASTICQASSPTAYTTSATNATSYAWSVTGAGNSISGTGTTGTVTWAAGFSGSATVIVVANGCNGPSASASTTVTVTPTVGVPSFTTGAITLCQDAADETYTATAANTTGIIYSVSPVGAGTIGLTSGIMDWDAGFSGTATITATASGCNGPTSADRLVTVNALPIVTASDVTGCSGSSIPLSGFGTPTGGTGNYSVANPYVGTSSTTYTYTYTDLNGCAATSDPANITITPQPLWYLDADGDQYYTGSAVPSCTSPGANYTTSVLGGGDCDDSNNGIYPGATEICWNGILENCSGTLSQGCAPVVVNMTSSYNNFTLPSLSIAVPAVTYNYGGFTNLKYRFSITNVTTNTTAPDIIQTSRYVTIPAVIHAYNSQFTIKVSAVINDEIVPFAGNTITVFSPTVQLITLNNATCGATLSSLASTLTANPGLNATGYTFRIRLNDANPTPTYYYSQSGTRFVGANSFSGLQIQYSASYKVSVQYSFIDPVTNLPTESGYGAECTVNTPSIPLISLTAPTCGSQVATMNANITAAAASYATSYQFRIRLFSDNGPTPTYYYSVPTASRFSSLTAFQGITLAYNTAYSISVQYSMPNGASPIWSGYGAECKVTTPFFPVTSLIPNQCGQATPTSLTQQLNISPYPGFPHYKVLLEEIDGEDVINSEEREISYPHFKLSDFSIAALGKNYAVSVAIKLNGVFGDYDTACDLFTPAPGKTETMEMPFKAIAYPNPFADNFMLDVKTVSQSSVSMKVYDILGRLIEQRNITVSDMATTTIGNQYPSGVYNVIISQDNSVDAVRVVKR